MITLERPQPKLSMADKAARVDAICEAARILPVITIAREQDILPLADALAAGGLTALEVTLRSEFGLKAIQVLREQRPELCTGAGTVLATGPSPSILVTTFGFLGPFGIPASRRLCKFLLPFGLPLRMDSFASAASAAAVAALAD